MPYRVIENSYPLYIWGGRSILASYVPKGDSRRNSKPAIQDLSPSPKFKLLSFQTDGEQCGFSASSAMSRNNDKTVSSYQLRGANCHPPFSKPRPLPLTASTLHGKRPVYLPELLYQVPIPIGQPSFILERIERILQRYHRQEVLIVFKCVILRIGP